MIASLRGQRQAHASLAPELKEDIEHTVAIDHRDHSRQARPCSKDYYAAKRNCRSCTGWVASASHNSRTRAGEEFEGATVAVSCSADCPSTVGALVPTARR